MKTKKITELTADDVMLVYSGRPGCGCGCKGKYHANPAMRAEADAHRGYPYEAEEVSILSVKRILKTMQARASEVTAHANAGKYPLVIYAIEDDARYYWLYVPAARAVVPPTPTPITVVPTVGTAACGHCQAANFDGEKAALFDVIVPSGTVDAHMRMVNTLCVSCLTELALALQPFRGSFVGRGA